jgi:hypothetical protein
MSKVTIFTVFSDICQMFPLAAIGGENYGFTKGWDAAVTVAFIKANFLEF